MTSDFFMSIQQDLLDLDELFNFSDLSTFAQNIPVEWIESALRLSSKATIRRRRLPSEQVLWLVLGMALFRDEPVHEVARRLNVCAQGLASGRVPTPLNGCSGKPATSGQRNATRVMIGTGYKSWRSMARY